MTPAETVTKLHDIKGMQWRVLELARTDGDTIPCVISTDAEVNVHGTPEILSHTQAAVDLTRAPLPLVDSHNTSALPLGIVGELRVAGGKLRGHVKFGNSERARQLLADVKAGVLRHLSVGYEILQYHFVGATRVVTSWRPLEVSAVSVPADIGAGFYRSAGEIMEQEVQERDRCTSIIRAARMFDSETAALDAITSGESPSTFRQKVVMHAATRPAALGMSRTELRRYDLARGIAAMCDPQGKKDFEWEIHAESPSAM